MSHERPNERQVNLLGRLGSRSSFGLVLPQASSNFKRQSLAWYLVEASLYEGIIWRDDCGNRDLGLRVCKEKRGACRARVAVVSLRLSRDMGSVSMQDMSCVNRQTAPVVCESMKGAMVQG